MPHMCITCEHHDGEHFHCNAKGSYVSYAYAFEKNKCKNWELSADYKKGGKFYEQDVKRMTE